MVMHAFRGARDWLDWGSAVEIDVYTTSLGETSHGRRWLAQKIRCQRNMYQFRWEAWHEFSDGVLRALFLLVAIYRTTKFVREHGCETRCE